MSATCANVIVTTSTARSDTNATRDCVHVDEHCAEWHCATRALVIVTTSIVRSDMGATRALVTMSTSIVLSDIVRRARL